jgi:hypothetical protein
MQRTILLGRSVARTIFESGDSQGQSDRPRFFPVFYLVFTSRGRETCYSYQLGSECRRGGQISFFSKGGIMSGPLFVETLESRRLLSIAFTTPMAPRSPWPSSPTITPISRVLQGTTINAEANQSFRAVIGTIRRLKDLPSGYTLRGDINWGDGTPISQAQFVRQSDGTIAVIGEHTYANAGGYQIKVLVEAVPPPASLAPVLVIGTLSSKAKVIEPNGGVTLVETAGVSFTDNVGYFHSTVDPKTMSAVIDWGDGTQSQGTIVELPTAGPIPTFAVVGTHTYSTTGSYLAHVTVYASSPQPSPTAVPPVYLVAQFDSVIDVLPPEPPPTAG